MRTLRRCRNTVSEPGASARKIKYLSRAPDPDRGGSSLSRRSGHHFSFGSAVSRARPIGVPIEQQHPIAMSATAPPAPPPARPTRQQLATVNSVMLALTSLFVAARLVIRLTARRPFEKPDFFIYFAFALFVAMWGCLMQENVPLFKVESLQRGEIPFYPEVSTFSR